MAPAALKSSSIISRNFIFSASTLRRKPRVIRFQERRPTRPCRAPVSGSDWPVSRSMRSKSRWKTDSPFFDDSNTSARKIDRPAIVRGEQQVADQFRAVLLDQPRTRIALPALSCMSSLFQSPPAALVLTLVMPLCIQNLAKVWPVALSDWASSFS